MSDLDLVLNALAKTIGIAEEVLEEMRQLGDPNTVSLIDVIMALGTFGLSLEQEIAERDDAWNREVQELFG